ncbi:unnamed protein product [Plutella xylostella]|uniref:(diamondback moth) hypothetical protein n=1 Tax=Plutella xylostella TaxID=51655 RepID=A0A8S4GAC8_PLUXY|nr:unnamed protein product [Plutella xylostella]
MLRTAPRGIGRRRRVGTWHGAAAGGGGVAARRRRLDALLLGGPGYTLDSVWAGLYPGLLLMSRRRAPGEPLVLRFTRRAVKDELTAAARVRRGATSADLSQSSAPRPFYVNERLTKYNRQLYYQTREVGRRLSWRFLWTKKGRIYARQGQDTPRHWSRYGHDELIATVLRYDVDIMAINETWLREGETDRAPVIPGYKLRHTPRPPGKRMRGGGVGMYVKTGLKVRFRTHPAAAGVEQMWLHIRSTPAAAGCELYLKHN